MKNLSDYILYKQIIVIYNVDILPQKIIWKYSWKMYIRW